VIGASPIGTHSHRGTSFALGVAAAAAVLACSSEPADLASSPGDVPDIVLDDVDDADVAEDGTDTPDPDRSDSAGPACDPRTGATAWSVLAVCREPGELLAVGGTSWHDVWIVGAGGTLLHFDGCDWASVPSGTTEDLWWVHAFGDGHAVVSGAGGTLLHVHLGEAPVAVETGTSSILFGVWGASPDDLWTVGFEPKGGGAVVLRVRKGEVESIPVPIPDGAAVAAPFKVAGSGPSDVWIVGRDDLVLHYDGLTLTPTPTGAGTDGDWVTVAMDGGQPLLVGGASNARIATRSDVGWTVLAPDFVPALQGVCVAPDGARWATGVAATILREDPVAGFSFDDDAPLDLFSPFDPPVPGCGQPTPDYHACWFDDRGNLYVVGGNFLTLGEGALLFRGPPGMPSPP
jgi:hypothetical protein